MSHSCRSILGRYNLRNLENLVLSFNNISEIEGLENLENLKYLSLLGNEFTEIKGFENLTNLRYLRLGLGKRIGGYTLNGKKIPTSIARKMGIKHSQGVYIIEKKMVRYCQFVKETGNVDFTTPGLSNLYEEWKKNH